MKYQIYLRNSVKKLVSALAKDFYVHLIFLKLLPFIINCMKYMVSKFFTNGTKCNFPLNCFASYFLKELENNILILHFVLKISTLCFALDSASWQHMY